MQEKVTSYHYSLLKGIPLRTSIVNSIKIDIENLQIQYQLPPPQLAIILVGDNKSSLVYIKQKILIAEQAGIKVDFIQLPTKITTQQLVSIINRFNKDSNTNGIILQLPIPDSIDVQVVIESIEPTKDVDGFHPINVGKMAAGYIPYFYPATPLGILKLLQFYNISVSGKSVVILNRSNIIGKPLSFLLGAKASYGNATVTLCHTYTNNTNDYIKNADILISATSLPHSINASMIKKGSILIDLGQYVDTTQEKRIITGDINIQGLENIASAVTPVPGGVGPTTVAILIENVFKAYVKQNSLQVDYDFF